MLNKIIKFSLNNRIVVLIGALLLRELILL